MGHDFAGRLGRAAQRVRDTGSAALVVAPGPDLMYLTGYDAPPLERLRAVKDAFEIELLHAASSAADRAFDRVVNERFEGRTERDVADDLARLLVEEGHDVPLFTIVGSGPNGASPHHEPGGRVIRAG